MNPSSSISVLLAALLMACCGHKGSAGGGATQGGSDNPGKVVIKDGERTEAPVPGSNDPAKLDSIKQEKAREKNKP
ncbi:MAG: hypothetical protein IT228_13435 [Flavobacteriales bacterium]|nr:hypothetical protein [Flavobacteriales bacterium]MCC6578337.1 hypothetical protein [Flavobacteriales bacterium]NUQ13694.1 hypothetical protein [Flavobacteriales bacterium]